jgi:hypothetical protein
MVNTSSQRHRIPTNSNEIWWPTKKNNNNNIAFPKVLAIPNYEIAIPFNGFIPRNNCSDTNS